MQSGGRVRSPEFELVLACVHWPLEAADEGLIRSLAQQPIHWPHLLRIVHHHQVASLVSRNLEAAAPDLVPPESLSSLRASAVENAHICFHGISDLARIHRRFCEEQIDHRIFKGTPLAIQAFGDATLRGAGDIDLLVSQGDISRADEILCSEGYIRCEPEVWRTARRMHSYLSHQKDFSYENPKSGSMIDLHWRLFRNPWLPANAGIEEAGLAWVQLGRESIPTLPFEQLFLYLCVHGALDGWLRLKWLTDIGALLRQTSSEQFRATMQAAEQKQVLPEVSAAILLCQEHLGFESVPAGCLDSRNPSVARILRFARRLMASNEYCPERDLVPSTAWFLNELALHPNPRYRLELVVRSLFRPRVWGTVSLPDPLFPLYALISPFEWLFFRVRRFTGSLLRWAYGSHTPAARRPRRTLLPRFFRLGLSDVAMLAEAVVMLTFFRAALRFFPVERFTAWMGNGELSGKEANLYAEGEAIHIIRRVEWSVGAIVRHAPLTFVCFPQSLAAYFMLRRRRIASKLFYGVARKEQELKAHTWIKVGDRTVVGGDVESQFTVLAIFP